MKRFFSLSFFLLLALSIWAGKTPKYVFYFIGDGMSLNQVNGTETYLAALEGRIGIQRLGFVSFPHLALATSYSHSHGITDSAAGGTALATGHKTYNNCVGLLPDSLTPITSIAVWAKEAGAAVGIATSVSIDHATPACFYAHQTHRKKYYPIGQDLVKSNFDFFAGSDFLSPDNPVAGQPNLYQQAQAAGFTIARGVKAYEKLKNKAQRLILLQTEAESQRDRSSLSYAIDRQPGDMTLADITTATIDFLKKKNPKQFFCMIEGGKIDWACHSNDAATAFREVIDFDQAIAKAVDFYRQHPDETLIVITADHETGGLALGNGDYTLHTHLLQYQRLSSYAYSKRFRKLWEERGAAFSFDDVRNDLRQYFGFWDKVQISTEQEAHLRAAFEEMQKNKNANAKSLYAKENPVADAAKRILNENAHLGWSSGTHTNAYVPVYALGAGAEHFRGRIDNTEIPRTIAKLAGYKMPR